MLNSALTFVHFGGLRAAGGGGFVPLVLVAAVVGIAAWALARRDPLQS